MITKRFIGKNLIELKSIDSTNNYLSNFANKSKLLNGTVILAHNQTKGKGQRGNNWESEEGKNLTFSVFLKTSCLSVDKNFLLSIAVCNAVHAIVSKRITNTKIKWPNDIIVNDEKIAGILIENIIQGSYLSKTIVGIGINVNQTSFEIEKANPTSLYLQTGQKHIIDEVMFKVLEKIMEQIEFLHDKEFTNINENYDACLYKKDEICLFEMGEKRIEAKIEKVDNKGALVVSNKSGIYTKNHGEIKLVIA